MKKHNSKSSNLLYLQNKINKSKIGYIYIFSSSEWLKNSNYIIRNIREKFGKSTIIVRSCSFDEDVSSKTNAGKYQSILDVKADDTPAIKKAVSDVNKSLPKKYLNRNKIFIQKQVINPSTSGVIFTQLIDNSAPYYTINYEENSKKTNVITSGVKGQTKLFYLLRNNKINLSDPSLLKFKNIILSVKEIEEIFGSNLDIEFCIKKNEINIFQVRKLHKKNLDQKIIEHINKYIKLEQNKFSRYIKLYKQNVILSNMSDWNPAEMIGVRPKPLSLSLYKHLITDNNWSKQRFNFGYSDLRRHKLMVTFCGQPYININLSIKSLIPKSLPEKFKKKLHNIYIDLIYKKPFLHDKIEFEVIFNCWEPNLAKKIKKRFKDYKINDHEVKLLEKSLNILTKKNFENYKNKFIKFQKLKNNRKSILRINNKLKKAILLIDDVKKYGIEPFAHAARYAFMSINILNSFVENKLISNSFKESFLLNLNTDISAFIEDKKLFKEKKISKEKLLEKYGHLRPGTYDITVDPYWKNFSFYFENKDNKPKKNIKKIYNFTKLQKTKIRKSIKSLSLNLDISDFFDLLKFFIEARESFKFEFTKNISIALDLISDIDKTINAKDIAYLSFYDLKKMNINKLNINNIKKIITRNKKKYYLSSMTKLPQMLNNKNNFLYFNEFQNRPNFITNNKISGDISIYNKNDIIIKNSIILLEQADPGYEWLFSKNIKGFITKYGGANSHMSIRAAETNTTAIVGVGEEIFNRILNMKSIFIDCQNHIISENK